MIERSNLEEAAATIRDGLDDAFVAASGPDPECTGNVADALFRIGTALLRIADALERKS